MYKFEIQGWENVPKDRPALFVSLHTFQSADIPMCLSGASVKTGRVRRHLLTWLSSVDKGAVWVLDCLVSR